MPAPVEIRDLGFWWVGNGGWYQRIGPPRFDSTKSTDHQRAEAIDHSLQDPQNKLRQIEIRKKHGLPPK